MRHLMGAGVLGTTADAATTWLAIQIAALENHLHFVELNPAVAMLIDVHGPGPAMVFRGVGGLGLFAFLGWAAGHSRWKTRPLALATVLTWLVVIWNVRMLQIALG